MRVFTLRNNGDAPLAIQIIGQDGVVIPKRRPFTLKSDGTEDLTVRDDDNRFVIKPGETISWEAEWLCGICAFWFVFYSRLMW